MGLTYYHVIKISKLIKIKKNQYRSTTIWTILIKHSTGDRKVVIPTYPHDWILTFHSTYISWETYNQHRSTINWSKLTKHSTGDRDVVLQPNRINKLLRSVLRSNTSGEIHNKYRSITIWTTLIKHSTGDRKVVLPT